MLNGPFGQAFAVLGLALLVPTAWMLVVGDLSPLEAAQRGVVTTLAVLVTHRAVRWSLARAVHTIVRHRAAADELDTP